VLVAIKFRIIALLCDIEEHKVKVKVTLQQATKAQRGSRGIIIIIITTTTIIFINCNWVVTWWQWLFYM
jgi:hypothetical protein